jgi:hypothetical protein
MVFINVLIPYVSLVVIYPLGVSSHSFQERTAPPSENWAQRHHGIGTYLCHSLYTERQKEKKETVRPN